LAGSTRSTDNDNLKEKAAGVNRHAAVRALTSHSAWKRPDARRLPDDTRRAPQPNRELQAFGTAESNLCEFRGRKRTNRRPHLSVRMHPKATKPFSVADEAALK
jgi:hypothetical protein